MDNLRLGHFQSKAIKGLETDDDWMKEGRRGEEGKKGSQREETARLGPLMSSLSQIVGLTGLCFPGTSAKQK